jgi:hypothetical protein
MAGVPQGWAERVAAATKTIKKTEKKKSAPKAAPKSKK